MQCNYTILFAHLVDSSHQMSKWLSHSDTNCKKLKSVIMPFVTQFNGCFYHSPIICRLQLSILTVCFLNCFAWTDAMFLVSSVSWEKLALINIRNLSFSTCQKKEVEFWHRSKNNWVRITLSLHFLPVLTGLRRNWFSMLEIL